MYEVLCLNVGYNPHIRGKRLKRRVSEHQGGQNSPESPDRWILLEGRASLWQEESRRKPIDFQSTSTVARLERIGTDSCFAFRLAAYCRKSSQLDEPGLASATMALIPNFRTKGASPSSRRGETTLSARMTCVVLRSSSILMAKMKLPFEAPQYSIRPPVPVRAAAAAGPVTRSGSVRKFQTQKTVAIARTAKFAFRKSEYCARTEWTPSPPRRRVLDMRTTDIVCHKRVPRARHRKWRPTRTGKKCKCPAHVITQRWCGTAPPPQ